MCAFFVILFVWEDNWVFFTSFHQSKFTFYQYSLISQKLIGFQQNVPTFFFFYYIKEYILKVIQQSSIAFLSWSPSKLEKGADFKDIHHSKFSQQLHCEFWCLYEMKTWLFPIRHVRSFFKKCFGILNKAEKYTPDFSYTEVCLIP